LAKDKLKSDPDANANLATAVYIASYFEENMSGSIFEKNYGSQSKAFQNFKVLWKSYFRQNIDSQFVL
jgi:hypothetical protein